MSPGKQRVEVLRTVAGAAPRWDRFDVDPKACRTVADALDAIARSPVTLDGTRVEPLSWSGPCEALQCGPCAMLVQGMPRYPCVTPLVEVSPKGKPIRLRPLQKLPAIADLWVDRDPLDAARHRLHAWLDRPLEASDREPGWTSRLDFARCSDCGACLDACPEARLGGVFVGAAAIGQAHLADLLAGPSPERAEALLQRGGIAHCGHADNCRAVCPEGVPLDRAIDGATRAATRRWLRTLFTRS